MLGDLHAFDFFKDHEELAGYIIERIEDSIHKVCGSLIVKI